MKTIWRTIGGLILGGAVLLILLTATVARAEVGTGFSSLFNVDTRWGFGTSFGVSGYFTVDTRFSGSTGEGNSGLFTVDTRGAVIGSATISGCVRDANNTGLSGATVSALQNGVMRAQTVADFAGAYALASLPEGTYQVQAAQAGYLTVNDYGVSLAANQSVVQNFSLSGKPAAPVVVTAANPPPVTTGTFPTGTLKKFDGNGFVVGGPFDYSKPTVILTHGWNSDAAYWPTDMAKSMIAGGANANVLAWDWWQEANTNLSAATSATRREGEKLGQALAATFTPAYSQAVHFIGHSLGTLVNATAANYIHMNGYSWTRTHMTLLDDAEEANWVSSASFVSPIPSQRAWIDNYVSFVGLYHPEAVNVMLEESSYYVDASSIKAALASVHGYACRWYGYTAATPNQSALGNRYSYEQLGSAAQFPSPNPYPLSSVFSQDIVSGELGLTRLYTADEIAAAASIWAAGWPAGITTYGLQSSMNFAVGAAQKIGMVALDVVMSFIPDTPLITIISSGTAGSTPAYYTYTQNPIESLPVWSFQVNLQTQPATFIPLQSSSTGGVRPMGGSSGGSNSLACIWIPVQIPTNAAIFAFDFTFNGEPVNDLLSASIGGTNVFALEARFMPTNTALNSGPIDVSQWAGQTVELFLGLVGGTSTNASVTLDGMRFYNVVAPFLTAQVSGSNVVIQWPLSANGYVLETTADLAATNAWTTVTNVPTIVDLQNTVTNPISGGKKFYRLRK